MRDEPELHRIGDSDGQYESNDGPCGVAKAFANSLGDDDHEEQTERQDEAVGYKISRAGCVGRIAPVKVERMQKAADCEHDEEEEKLEKSGEEFFHVCVDARDEFDLRCWVR